MRAVAQRQHYAAIALQASIERLHRAQIDASKASVLCQSSDYERCHMAVREAREDFNEALSLIGIDGAVIREGLI